MEGALEDDGVSGVVEEGGGQRRGRGAENSGVGRREGCKGEGVVKGVRGCRGVS